MDQYVCVCVSDRAGRLRLWHYSLLMKPRVGNRVGEKITFQFSNTQHCWESSWDGINPGMWYLIILFWVLDALKKKKKLHLASFYFIYHTDLYQNVRDGAGATWAGACHGHGHAINKKESWCCRSASLGLSSNDPAGSEENSTCWLTVQCSPGWSTPTKKKKKKKCCCNRNCLLLLSWA